MLYEELNIEQMSKQHTPKRLSQYIDREITDIRIKAYSGAPSDEIEHRLHGLNLYIISNLGDIQNNHDRLVEALTDSRLMLSQLRRSMMTHPDHMIAGAQIIEDRIERLLTELKQQ